ncbi:hypothetical protein FKP32DRAFT_1586671 [Trametes sanguinea]|nr:hypothetical protein FKP32DRAFT_1586671 [Trametes sanguinea]
MTASARFRPRELRSADPLSPCYCGRATPRPSRAALAQREVDKVMLPTFCGYWSAGSISLLRVMSSLPPTFAARVTASIRIGTSNCRCGSGGKGARTSLGGVSRYVRGHCSREIVTMVS